MLTVSPSLDLDPSETGPRFVAAVADADRVARGLLADVLDGLDDTDRDAVLVGVEPDAWADVQLGRLVVARGSVLLDVDPEVWDGMDQNGLAVVGEPGEEPAPGALTTHHDGPASAAFDPIEASSHTPEGAPVAAPAAPPAGAAGAFDPATFANVQALRDYAEANKIDLGKARKRAEVEAAIAAAVNP